MKECECEHSDHFDQGPGHIYGKYFSLEQLVSRRTRYGLFSLCQECNEAGHMPRRA
jgi:hypothetical protein